MCLRGDRDKVGKSWGGGGLQTEKDGCNNTGRKEGGGILMRWRKEQKCVGMSEAAMERRRRGEGGQTAIP